MDGWSSYPQEGEKKDKRNRGEAKGEMVMVRISKATGPSRVIIQCRNVSLRSASAFVLDARSLERYIASSSTYPCLFFYFEQTDESLALQDP